MTIDITTKEAAMLVAFVEAGIECNAASDSDELINDNVTWMNANDLAAELGWGKQAIGGVMKSLWNKCLISDTEESPRGAKVTDWIASEETIRWYFDNKA
tara:strand:- start:2130 stop:2429 length:300 start_codon:yes stop_codon:yes gene_type:complete